MTGLDKDGVSPAVARAQQLLREKRYADALQVCNDELARGADDAELRLVAAQSLLAQGRQEGAKKEAQQAVRLDPTLAEAHRVLAEVACTRGELAIARDHLNRVLELDPDDEKSGALLESLSRPVGVAAAAETSSSTPDASNPPPAAASSSTPAARMEESAPFELSSEDLEEDIEEAEPPPQDRRTHAKHVDPFSGESFPLSKGENLPAVGEVPVSDSMVVGLPVEIEASGPERGLKTLPEMVSSPSIFEPGAQPPTGGPKPPRPPSSEGPPLFDAGPTSASGGREPAAPTQAPPSVEEAWKPAMDAGAGTARKYEGTLRLPALDDLPEEEDAPTMPLLRPSGPPKPQLRLDPMAPQPIEERLQGALHARPAVETSVTVDERPRGPRLESPVAGQPGRRGLLSDSDDAFGFVEPADSPIPQHTVPIDKDRRRASDPSESEIAAAESTEDLLAMMAGRRKDPSLPDTGGRERPPRPTGPMRDAGRSKRPSAGTAPIRREPSRGGRPSDPEDEAPTALLDDLLAPAGERILSAEDIERQIAVAASSGALLESGERPVMTKSHRQRRPSRVRWVLVAAIGLVIGGGGLAGYLYYTSWKFVQKEWGKLREAVHRSTPDGYRDARAAAERILRRQKNDPKALAAVAMCDAAMSLEFGDDRIKSARELLDRSRGTDSEWRTAATAFLALMDEPARAEGYLAKGLEVYPDSALLHYLRGRALAAGESNEKAAEAFKGALKLAPKYVAARIGLVALEGQTAEGYTDAVRALDEIVAGDKDCLQALIERARLRARHGKDLDEASIDALRVTGDLAAKAGRGQLGWAHLVLAQVTAQSAAVKKKEKWVVVNQELDAAIHSPPCCDSDFRHELSGELMKVYRMADAQAQMKEALALKPKRTEYVHRLARVLIELDDPAAALAQLQNAPARHPETRLLNGRAFFAQASYGKAADAFKTVLAENKKNLEAAMYLELCKARRGSTSEATAALEKLASTRAGSYEPFKALGQLHLAAGELPKAESTLKAAWKMNKLDPAVPTLLGIVSVRRHDLDRALTRFNRALEIRGDYRPARIAMAQLMVATGKLQEARKQASLIAENERMKADARALEVELDIAEGKLDAARAAITEAENAGLRPSQLHRLVGALALAKKQGKQAEEALRKALKLGGREIKDADLFVMLGRAQLITDKVDDAYDTFHLALKEDAGHPLALLEIGRIAIKDGELNVALKRLTEALAKMKERQCPTNLVAQVHGALGAAYLKRKDTGRALTSLQDAIELDSTAAEPQFLMGQTYDQLNHPQRSVQHYLKALQLDSSRSEIHELLGRAYAKMGEAANAIKSFEEYLRSNPPAAKVRAVKQELAKLQGQ